MNDRHRHTGAMAVRRPEIRRKFLNRLRPEAGSLALDLDLLEIVAELDPGMVDWRAEADRFAAGSWGASAPR